MKKSIRLGLSAVTAFIWVCSLEGGEKAKPEAFTFEKATVVQKNVEVEGKKPKVVYFLEMDGNKIEVKDVKALKKLVGKSVSVSGQGIKKEDAWKTIVKVEKVEEIK